MEEFGMSRDTGGYDASTPVSVRDRWFQRFFDIIEDSIASGAPIVGSNVWAWGGEGRGNPPTYRYRPGDPFTGDPSHEPQGFNSVFDTDSTTRAILRDHAAQLRRLRSLVSSTDATSRQNRERR
jgi:mannan endo-1,4-beta-mannosidase